LRILILHNRYQQEGGEDVVVRAEMDLLLQQEHTVRIVEADNAQINGLFSQMRTAIEAVYSPGARRRVASELAAFGPDVVHVHNFFPLLSPGVYYACRDAGVPVVQTLHNYRLICCNAVLFRDGRVCEECVGRPFAWPGIVHCCYRGSRLGTASIAAMQAAHRAGGTWQECVDMYVALTEFSRDTFVRGGLPADKIAVKPNFAARRGPAGIGRGDYGLFVGRLSPEKGIETLLAACEYTTERFPIWIVGDGPLAEQTKAAAAKSSILHLGRRTQDEVSELMRDAAFLILPSLCYENFPLVIAEAFEAGLPVIASDLGSPGSLVTPGRTGLLFRPGDPKSLAEQIDWAVAHPEELSRMRRRARWEYEEKYTPERNYELLMEIYEQTLSQFDPEKRESTALVS
jgi:glycosyltransferase involved in cell wall biosynthesis